MVRPEPTGARAAPLEPGRALLALEDAADREQIFDVLLRAVRSQMRFAALLSVHADELRGRRALAENAASPTNVGRAAAPEAVRSTMASPTNVGRAAAPEAVRSTIDRAQVETWRIPRGSVPAFEAAIRSTAPSVGRIASDEPFVSGFLDQLGAGSPAVLVLPVAIGTRTVALVVAHRGGDAFELADAAEVIPLAAAASPALARVLAARSKAAPKPDYEVEVAGADASKLRARVAELRTGARWQELADALRALVALGVERGDPDEDEQLERLIELGHVEAEQLHQVDAAIDAWRSAQAIDAGEPRVLEGLGAVFAREARWTDSADLLEKRIALADSPAARIALLLELAQIAHERLDDDERAIAAYEQILNWEPAHDHAIRELEHLYSGREQWQPLAALLLDRASHEPDPKQALAALEAVAQMYEDKLCDTRAAFLVWLAAVRHDPQAERALDEWLRLAGAALDRDEVIAEGRALAEELDATHPRVAARVWYAMAGWARDHAANRDDAVLALEHAHHASPDDSAILGELSALLADGERWGELVALLAARADTEPSATRRAELHAQLGGIYDEQLGEPAEAIAVYEQALADAPDGRGELVALHRLYRQMGAWPKLAALLPQRIAAADVSPTERVELNVELGGVLADQLARTEEAIRAYQAALADEPEHPVAFKALAELYRATGQTEALLDANEAQADAGDRATQIARYPELAEAWRERGRGDRAAACWHKLVAIEPKSPAALRGLAGALAGAGELDGALTAYQQALAIEPDHAGALDALARVYERSGESASALGVLARLLDRVQDRKPRAELFRRIGAAHFDVDDVPTARGDFLQALELDPENAAAHEGLARVHLKQDKIASGGDELVRAGELAADPADKARCFTDAAWVFRHRLKDAERARQCLLLVLELEPEHADAKLALAQLLQDTQQWESLWPHLHEEVKRAEADAQVPAAERADIFTRAARCALELDKLGDALELYERAVALDASPALQIERAEALYRSRSLVEAASAFQTIVLRFQQTASPTDVGRAAAPQAVRSTIDRNQLVGVYRRLAEIHTQLGKLSQAQLFHQKVLDLEPKHGGSLRDLAELHVARGRFDDAIASLRRLAETTSGAERAAILARAGDLYRDKLKNAQRAIATYHEALDADAGNRALLQRLLDQQTAAGQWKLATETIERFLEHESDPVRRAAYHLAAAEIRRAELRDKAGALAAYERALDDLFREDPLQPATRARGLEAFQIVDEIATADKNWKYQEQAYRRMIKRLPSGDPALVALWDALGEVYRTRLKHYQSALEALELAHSLDAEKRPQRAAILAELYALAGKPQKAQHHAAKLVELDPNNAESYRAVGRASLEAGRIDEAWCAARALVFLKAASADEAALYKRLRAHEARKATGILDSDAWAWLQHKDEDKAISAIFAHVWPGPVALRAGPAKAFDLKPKERLPVEDGTRTIAKLFRHATRVLNISLPDVYVQPQRAGRLLLANCIDRGRLVPAVVVARDLMTGYRDTELAAAIGALLAQLRPAYYLKLVLPNVDELEAALAAAAELGGRPGVGRAELAPLRETFVAEMRERVPKTSLAHLPALVAHVPDAPDLRRWRTAVDAAAHRAGLLVAGELAAAARMLSTEPGAKAKQRVAELVAYSVSPGYFAARRHLGVAVE